MPFTDPHGVPASTYRLQLRKEFPFADATRIVPYLHALGVSHLYLSPVLMSAPGSTHGYDVNDYHRIAAGSRRSQWIRRAVESGARARHGNSPGFCAESHGHRRIVESLVAGRAGVRALFTACGLLRYRLAGSLSIRAARGCSCRFSTINTAIVLEAGRFAHAFRSERGKVYGAVRRSSRSRFVHGIIRG